MYCVNSTSNIKYFKQKNENCSSTIDIFDLCKFCVPRNRKYIHVLLSCICFLLDPLFYNNN